MFLAAFHLIPEDFRYWCEADSTISNFEPVSLIQNCLAMSAVAAHSYSNQTTSAKTRVLLCGGDNMWGRAVQLSCVNQVPGSDAITGIKFFYNIDLIEVFLFSNVIFLPLFFSTILWWHFLPLLIYGDYSPAEFFAPLVYTSGNGISAKSFDFAHNSVFKSSSLPTSM